MAAIVGVAAEEITQNPVSVAQENARTLGSAVVLKGAETVISDPDGSTYLNRRGNAGLATAGSGDVLAGFIAGICARHVEPVQAAVWAVTLHARAGEKLASRVGPIGYLARELPAEVPGLMRQLTRRR